MNTQHRSGLDHDACLLLQFQLSYSDKQRYEMEERPDAQKQILVEIAKKLPIFTRAQSGGKVTCHAMQYYPPVGICLLIQFDLPNIKTSLSFHTR